MTHCAGTPLTVLPGQGFAGSFSLADFLNCQGTLSAVANGSINLNGGVAVSGTGNVSLGSGAVSVNNAPSGITGRSLSASAEYVGTSGTGSLTQSGGTNTVTSVLSLGGSGTYNLTGGVLVAASIQGTGTFNLGGGTLVASAGFSTSQAMTLTGGGGNGNINTGGYPLIAAGSISGSLGPRTSGTVNGFPATLGIQGNDIVLNVVPEPLNIGPARHRPARAVRMGAHETLFRPAQRLKKEGVACQRGINHSRPTKLATPPRP